jgi:Flp pilus assembly pilin Flp
MPFRAALAHGRSLPHGARAFRKEVTTMLRHFFRRLHIETGQTMAEYGVVLAVITIGIIVALTALSGGITNALNTAKGYLP